MESILGRPSYLKTLRRNPKLHREILIPFRQHTSTRNREIRDITQRIDVCLRSQLAHQIQLQLQPATAGFLGLGLWSPRALDHGQRKLHLQIDGEV